MRAWKKGEKDWKPVLRHILNRDYGLAEVTVAKDEWGKPYLEDCPLFFNISHSGEYLAIAVSKEPVGVDIEGARVVKEGTIRKVVQPQEQELIGTERAHDFLRLWTLKESFLKAEGKGLRIPFGDYYFQRENGKYFVIYHGQRAPWSFNIEETVVDGYIVSVCGREKEVSFRTEQER